MVKGVSRATEVLLEELHPCLLPRTVLAVVIAVVIAYGVVGVDAGLLAHASYPVECQPGSLVVLRETPIQIG